MSDIQEFTAAPVAITATTPPPHDLVMGVANVLEGARTIALRKWDKDRCDLYHVAERAWRAQAMAVPLAAVTAQLRRVVPDGKLLTYQDQEGRTRADIAAKFTEARDALLAGNTALTRQAGDMQASHLEDSPRTAAPLIIGDNEDEPPTTAVTNISLAHLLGLDLSYDEWQRKSLCAQTDPEAFFPEKGGSTRDAKRICQRCPVIGDCLNAALANDERFGIWGGLSERERRRLKRNLEAANGAADADEDLDEDDELDELDEDDLDADDDDLSVVDEGSDDDALGLDFNLDSLDDFNADIRKAG
jgi:WhiB family redox-sensing transcriptional regulator